jgi:hypothetical protein
MPPPSSHPTLPPPRDVLHPRQRTRQRPLGRKRGTGRAAGGSAAAASRRRARATTPLGAADVRGNGRDPAGDMPSTTEPRHGATEACSRPRPAVHSPRLWPGGGAPERQRARARTRQARARAAGAAARARRAGPRLRSAAAHAAALCAARAVPIRPGLPPARPGPGQAARALKGTGPRIRRGPARHASTRSPPPAPSVRPARPPQAPAPVRSRAPRRRPAPAPARQRASPAPPGMGGLQPRWGCAAARRGRATPCCWPGARTKDSDERH